MKRFMVVAGVLVLLGWFVFGEQSLTIFDHSSLITIKQSFADLVGKLKLSEQAPAHPDELAKSFWGYLITFLVGSGGVAILIFKFFLSESSATIAARRKFTEKVTDEISELAKKHYWSLANYSGLLARQFEDYLISRNQFLLFQWPSRADLKAALKNQAADCADRSFWTFCQLLLLFDDFQFKGSNTYLLASHSSGELAKKLYNQFMATLPQRDEQRIYTLKILKVLRERISINNDSDNLCLVSDLPEATFMAEMQKAQGNISLNAEFDRYTQWIAADSGNLEQAAKSLRAYSELLTHELSLIHQNWYSRKRRLFQRQWPSSAVSEDSSETLQRVRYESSFYAAMAGGYERQSAPKLEGESSVDQDRTNQETLNKLKWVWQKDTLLEDASENPEETPTSEKFILDKERLKSKFTSYFSNIKTSINSINSSIQRAIVRYLNVWKQTNIIERAQLESAFSEAVTSYVEGKDEKCLIYIKDIIPRLPGNSISSLGDALLLEGIQGQLFYYTGNNADAIKAYRHAIKYAKKAIVRINRLSDKSRDRRKLQEYMTYLAILYKVLATVFIELHKYYLADKYLEKSRKIEPDWGDIYETKYGKIKQEQAWELSKKGEKTENGEKGEKGDFNKAIEILDESYNALLSRGFKQMAGRSAYQRAILQRDHQQTKEAIEWLGTSYDCYSDPDEPGSKATILGVAADMHIDAGNIDEALQRLNEAIEISLNQEKNTLAKDACTKSLAKRGVLYLKKGLADEAKADILLAIDKYKKEGWGNPYKGFLDAIPALLRDSTLRSRLKAFFERCARGISDVEDRALAVDAVMELLNTGAESIETPNHNIHNLQKERLSVTTPLVVTISEKYLTSEYDSWDVAKAMKPIRDYFEERYGVKIPGVRFRADENMKDDVFEVGLMEVATKYKISDPDVKNLKVEIEIDSKSFGPFYIPMKKLLEMLTSKLSLMVGHQEIQNYLETYCGEAMVKDIAGYQTHRHLDPLTNVVQSMLNERVPILPFPEIRETVERLQKDGISLTEIVEKLRIQEKTITKLWGASQEHNKYRLGPTIEREMRASIREISGFPALVVKKETCEIWLAAIREKVSNTPKCSIIVRDHWLRPLLRNLIGEEFKEASVLTFDEVSVPLDKYCDTIEIT